MNESTQQAILTLSSTIRQAAQKVVAEADFPRFYSGQVLEMLGDGKYKVAMGDQIVELPVYGKGILKTGQFVHIVSPYNSKELSQFWILGPSGGGSSGSGSGDDSELYELVMQLRRDVGNKLDKGAVTQTTGDSETNVMSQKAVTEALKAIESGGSSGVQGVRVGTTKLTSDAEGVVTVPIAKDALLGVVRSQTGRNQVSVASDGTMEVKTFDPMRLEQTDGDVLILDCGDSEGWW